MVQFGNKIGRGVFFGNCIFTKCTQLTHLLICDPAKKDNFPSHNLWRNFGNSESSPARYSFHKLDWSSLSASGSWQMLQIWGTETVFWSTQQIIFCREAPVVFTFCCALDSKPPSLSLSANLFLCSITVFSLLTMKVPLCIHYFWVGFDLHPNLSLKLTSRGCLRVSLWCKC